MREIKIDIDGMNCASCATNIEKSFRKIKGVKKASVNLMAKKGFIETEKEMSDKEIEEAVSRAGDYRVLKLNNKDLNKDGKNNPPRHENHDHSRKVEEKEINLWKKKMLWAWIITIPIAFIMFSERLFGIKLFDEITMTIVLLILSFPVIFIIGFSTLRGGLRGFINLYFNMDSLIALGTIIAYATGIMSLFMNILDYSGIASMIMAFFITGKYVETKARGKASQEIKKLLELGAKKARILRKNKEIEIPISEVVEGDVMIIKPGEKVPTDGIIIKGESSVDESMVTGESIPSDKLKGDNIIGSTINQDGILYVKATKVGKDTFLSHIIKLVENAQGTKIPIQRFADKVTSIFVPVILAITVLTFFAWMFILDASLSRAVGVSVSVLVIACPCALGLATPTALMVGSGMGAKKGILIRRGEAIQTMKEIKIIIFDKTGTITKGHPEVKKIYSKIKESYLLEIAASIEKLSEHPLSKAIVEKANLKKYKPVKNFKIIRGKGVEGKIGNKLILIGNSLLMKERGVLLKEIRSKIKSFEEKGYTSMIVSENKKPLGVIGVADAVKEDSISSIKELKNQGYRIVMITGDNERTAKAIAKQVGIKEVIANVLPDDKAKIVKKMKSKGMTAFVGDGINDAPALKESNVGIALGTGTDIAIESGDIVLSKGSLKGVVQAINLSKATFGKIKQNLFWAFAYNTLAIPLAIAGFLHPVIAEIAMALSSITVVGNANLLRRKKI
ncbi:MAG: heavy metal translocating P-type ATPase [Candidatus Pacearchaeota archaeon]